MTDQELNSKDASQFKLLRKLHDKKQYKKALKASEQLLKSHPNHGETLSMKGLTLNYLDRKVEAYECAKEGLKHNIRSSVCWHVYGLIYRSDRNYVEAIKCYANALRFHQGANVQILRDMAILQIQTRDFKGYQKSRKELIVLQSNMQGNWIGYRLTVYDSMAHHLAGNIDLALQILNLHISTYDVSRIRPTYEESEVWMYKAMLLEEDGRLEEVLQLLRDQKDDIVDIVACREQYASILLKLGKFDEATELFKLMFRVNPECYKYHCGLLACHLKISDISNCSGCQLPVQNRILEPKVVGEISGMYETMACEFPKALAVQRIPLDFLEGSIFQSHASRFLLMALRKGIPSLFSSLKPIYKIAFDKSEQVSSEIREQSMGKVKILGEIMDSFRNTLYKGEPLPGGTVDEAPTILLWILYFIAQHLDMCGERDKALVVIEEALVHTPTLVDLYFVKGRILKHMGSLSAASDSLESGRKLDLADKWINSKSVKFLLRAGRIAEAEEVVSLFTKHEGDSRMYLMDMQAMWFEVEAGNACRRSGNVALAMKLFKGVQKHFDDIQDDELDFHMYCLRKGTLRAYVSVLRLEDTIRSHPYFVTAASGAVKCYLQMCDNSVMFIDPSTIEPDYSQMTGAEKKKAKAKARKLQAKKLEEETAQLALTEANKKDSSSKKKDIPPDEDPLGEKAFQIELGSPLEFAHILLQKVLKVTPPSIRLCADIFDVQVRRGKHLQAIKAMRTACHLSAQGYEHPLVFPRLVGLAHMILKSSSVLWSCWKPLSDNEAVLSVLKSIAEECLGVECDTNALVKAYAKDHLQGPSIAYRMGACMALLVVDPASRPSCFITVVENLPSDECFVRFQELLEFAQAYGFPQEQLKELAVAMERQPIQ